MPTIRIVEKLAERTIDYIYDEAEKNADDKREYAGNAATRAERHNAAQARAEAKADRDFDKTVDRFRRLAGVGAVTDEESDRSKDTEDLARIMAQIASAHGERLNSETFESMYYDFLASHLAAVSYPSGSTGKAVAQAVALGAFALLADALDGSGARNLHRPLPTPPKEPTPTHPDAGRPEPIWTPPPVLSDPPFPYEPLPDEENEPR